MKRRSFLHGMGGMFAGDLLSGGLLNRWMGGAPASDNLLARSLFWPSVAQSVTGRSRPASSPIVVLVVFQGGNDGLNTVVPYMDDLYYARRPNIAIPQRDVVTLENGVGLHPSLAPLGSLWEDGQLAVLQGVGYPQMNLSHFRGTDILFTGSDGSDVLDTGWIARWLEVENPDFPSVLPTNPFALQQGLSARLPLQGERGITGMIVDNPSSFQELVDSTFPGQFEDTLGVDPGDSLLRAVREIDAASFEYANVLQAAAGAGTNREDYTNGGLSRQLATVARLLDGGLETPFFVTSLGGFDTHANQRSRHDGLMGEFAAAVQTFFRDLTAMGRADDVVLLSVSEFGRRVDENGSGGTDHGTAAPWFLVGPRVVGGVHGTAPDLGSLDPAGNLSFGMDFRSVYASLLQTWFGAEPSLAQSILGANVEALPILQAPLSEPGEPGDPGDPGDPAGPLRTKLSVPVPNPGSGSRVLRFDLAETARVQIEVFAPDGRRLASLVDETISAGRYERRIESGNLRSGVYLLRMTTGGRTYVQKLLVR